MCVCTCGCELHVYFPRWTSCPQGTAYHATGPSSLQLRVAHSAGVKEGMVWAGGQGGVPFCAVRPVKPPRRRADCGLLPALQGCLSTSWLFRAVGKAGGLQGQRCNSHWPQGGDGTDSTTHAGCAGNPVSRREQGRDRALSLLPSQPPSSRRPVPSCTFITTSFSQLPAPSVPLFIVDCFGDTNGHCDSTFKIHNKNK